MRAAAHRGPSIACRMSGMRRRPRHGPAPTSKAAPYFNRRPYFPGQDRETELEKRIDELEKKLDRLIEVVEKSQPKPAGEPERMIPQFARRSRPVRGGRRALGRRPAERPATAPGWRKAPDRDRGARGGSSPRVPADGFLDEPRRSRPASGLRPGPACRKSPSRRPTDRLPAGSRRRESTDRRRHDAGRGTLVIAPGRR